MKITKVEEMYLDYFNNFLTVDVFAEYYGITRSNAQAVIKEGRKQNHQKENK